MSGEAMLGGTFGRYLRVDLGEARAEHVPLDEGVLRLVLGGVGLGALLLTRESPPRVDPYGPDAAVVIALSPLVGTPLTTTAKLAVVGKSPLTERISDSLSSSAFALAGKRAGVDALVLRGRAREPVIVCIDGEQVELLPAGDLWGKDLSVRAAAEELARKLPGFEAALIGPAGERLVRYAGLSNGGRHAGRGGLGAVLGAKRVKAVAVRGERRIELAHPAQVVAIARDLSRRSLGPGTEKYRELGTVANLATFHRLAALPTRNFQQSTFEGAASLSGETLRETRERGRGSCAACTIGCEHFYEIAPGEGEVRVEYESVFALGPLCGVRDPELVLRAAQRCDDLGLDTISAGGTIAFAMECAERGLLDAPGLRFGAGDRLLALLDDIAARRGLGDLLAEGSRRVAARLGPPAMDFAPHVKGLEIPGYEPRALQTMALGFAVGARGADHNRSGAYEVDFSTRVDRLAGTPEAARLAVETEDRAALMDSLILCKFLRGVFPDFLEEAAAMLRAVTGAPFTREELSRTAQRIVLLKKLYNVREGWTAAEDTLPARFLSEGLPTGVARGATLPRERFAAMVRAYYEARGWREDGSVPDAERARLDVATLGLTP